MVIRAVPDEHATTALAERLAAIEEQREIALSTAAGAYARAGGPLRG
jgi:hypothetical protein